MVVIELGWLKRLQDAASGGGVCRSGWSMVDGGLCWQSKIMRGVEEWVL
jgi:hypothetical protein